MLSKLLKIDSYNGTQRNREKILWIYGANCFRPRHTRIQAAQMQRRPIHKDEFLMRFGGARGDIYRCIGKYGVYCLWILPHPSKCNEFTAYFQAYVRGRVPRYEHAVGDDPENGESRCEYDPMAMPVNGYDTYEDRRRTVSETESVCCVIVLEISISDSRNNRIRPRLDW